MLLMKTFERLALHSASKIGLFDVFSGKHF